MDHLINGHRICFDRCYLFSVCSQQKELWLRYLKMAMTFAVDYSFEIKSLMYYVIDTLTRLLLISVLHVNHLQMEDS